MPAPLPPVDPNVKLPPSVAALGARADALHAQAYANPDPAPEPVPPLAPAAAEPPAPQPAPPPAQSAEPAPAPVAPASGDQYPDKNATLTPDQWRHQYLSMKGRYEQATQSIGGLQEQLTELGDELLRTQQSRQQPRAANQDPAPSRDRVAAVLTQEEIQTYGPELIDVIQRAARAAVAPDMQNLHTGVQQVNQRVQQVSTGTLVQQLDAAVSDWRTINLDPRFKAWCGLRDVYSGQVRGTMLNAAFKAADAPRCIAFFQGFLNEEQATGQLPDPSVQPQPPAAARVPAIPLVSLTAPGRAHPAGGDTPQPVDKPVFTRAQIAAFYTAVRQGHYNGRVDEKNALEQQIFAAQRDGRVR